MKLFKIHFFIACFIFAVIFISSYYFSKQYSTFAVPLAMKLGVSILCYFLFVWEQKRLIICDKEAKTISVVEKALFQNDFILKDKVQLQDISELKAEIGYLNRNPFPLTVIISRLVIKTTDNKFIDIQASPLCIFKFSKMAEKIRNFTKEPIQNITLLHSPFILRIIASYVFIMFLCLLALPFIVEVLKQLR